MSVFLIYEKHGEGSESYPDTPSAIRAARAAVETGAFRPVAVRNPWGFVLLTEGDLRRKVLDGL